jgi:2-dehydro-3-deoxyglucarate aldolase
MITVQDVRNKLRAGKPSIGTWLQLPSPDVAEMLGQAGYDWAAVDMEHGAFARPDLPNMFRALEAGGTLPFVRLLESTPAQIKLALDSGARGLILPMIESFAQLDAAISSALYPGGKGCNSGTRGVGFSRANMYGRDLALHIEPQTGRSREIIIVAQIEHINAVNELDAIFSHPRLDAYMIGPYDLSASMNLTGDFSHSDFVAALETVRVKADEYKIPKGFHIVEPHPEELAAKAAEGYSFIAYGIDAVFLARKMLCPSLPD